MLILSGFFMGFLYCSVGREITAHLPLFCEFLFRQTPPAADCAADSSNGLSDCRFVCRCVFRCPRLEGACTANPCRHGGTCLDHWSWQQCQCVDGFTGKFCEKCKYMPLKCLFIAEAAHTKEYSIMTIYDSSLLSHRTAPCS